jgi:hypothetical protein
MAWSLDVDRARLSPFQRQFISAVEGLLESLALTRLDSSASDARWSPETGLEVELQHREDDWALLMVQVDGDDEIDVDLPRSAARNPNEQGLRVGFGADSRGALRLLESALRGNLQLEVWERDGRELEVEIVNEKGHAPELIHRVRFGILPIRRRSGARKRTERLPSFR